MNKKEFIALADMIRAANAEPRSPSRPMFDDAAIDRLARFCASQNPAFNRARWLAYIAGESGPSGGRVKKVQETARPVSSTRYSPHPLDNLR